MAAVDDLKKFLQSAPLYHIETIAHGAALLPQPQKTKIGLPKGISVLCGVCDHTTNWEFHSGGYESPDFVWNALYMCANCKTSRIWFFFLAGEKGGALVVQKVGQYPSQAVRPRKDIAKALGDHLPLYVKGMTCRHHSFGIGAHAYFRRLIEDTTDDMIDILAAAMQEAGEESKAIENVLDAKKAPHFEDKVKVAADMLPRHLRVGGHNPFAVLWDLLSRGLHKLTDEECIEIVDGMQNVLEYVFKELRLHTEERKTYTKGLHGALERLSKIPKKD